MIIIAPLQAQRATARDADNDTEADIAVPISIPHPPSFPLQDGAWLRNYSSRTRTYGVLRVSRQIMMFNDNNNNTYHYYHAARLPACMLAGELTNAHPAQGPSPSAHALSARSSASSSAHQPWPPPTCMYVHTVRVCPCPLSHQPLPRPPSLPPPPDNPSLVR